MGQPDTDDNTHLRLYIIRFCVKGHDGRAHERCEGDLASDLGRSRSKHLLLHSLTLLDRFTSLDGGGLGDLQNTGLISEAAGDHLLLNVLVDDAGQILHSAMQTTVLERRGQLELQKREQRWRQEDVRPNFDAYVLGLVVSMKVRFFDCNGHRCC